MTGFLDTEIAPAIMLTLKNKGQNVDTKYRLIWYIQYIWYVYVWEMFSEGVVPSSYVPDVAHMNLKLNKFTHSHCLYYFMYDY